MIHKKVMREKGQTLVILLVFMAISMTVVSASVMLSVSSSRGSSSQEVSFSALDAAESGLENAIVLLLRNSAYSGGTLTVADGTATITVTGSGPYIITSIGQVGNFVRTVRANISITSGVMTVNSWQEIFP
jgi:uncharacterized protein (UPF0333 family)